MPLGYENLPGDIDHLIAGDHAVVERQFQHLEARRGNRGVLVDQVAVELALRAFAEETVLHPLWEQVGMQGEHDDARQELQEIHMLKLTPGRSQAGESYFEEEAQRAVADHLLRAFGPVAV